MPGSDRSRHDVDGVGPDLVSARDELEKLVLIENFPAAVEAGEALLRHRLPPSFEAAVQFLLARAWVRLSDGQRAYPHAHRARLMYEAAGDGLMVAEALLEEGRALFFLGDPRTLPCVLGALDLCEHLDTEQSDLMVRVLIQTGGVYYEYGAWEKAIEFCDRALDCARHEPNLRLLARIHTILAGCHLLLGDHSEAIGHGRRAYTLFARSVHPADMARAEHNLGLLYVRVGRLDAAEEHVTRALDLTSGNPTPDAPLRADVLCAASELHLARNEFQAAEARLAEAAEVADRWNVRAAQAEAAHLTARLQASQGKFTAADAAFARAVTLLEAMGLTDRLAECHREHAHALRRQGRMDEAIEQMRAAYEAAAVGPNKLAAVMRVDMEAGSQLASTELE